MTARPFQINDPSPLGKTAAKIHAVALENGWELQPHEAYNFGDTYTYHRGRRENSPINWLETVEVRFSSRGAVLEARQRVTGQGLQMHLEPFDVDKARAVMAGLRTAPVEAPKFAPGDRVAHVGDPTAQLGVIESVDIEGANVREHLDGSIAWFVNADLLPAPVEPHCNHDAAAVRNGVCECGEVVVRLAPDVVKAQRLEAAERASGATSGTIVVGDYVHTWGTRVASLVSPTERSELREAYARAVERCDTPEGPLSPERALAEAGTALRMAERYIAALEDELRWAGMGEIPTAAASLTTNGVPA